VIHAIHLITGRLHGAMRVVVLVLAGAATLLAGSPAAAQDRSPANCDIASPSQRAEGRRASRLIGMNVVQATLELLSDHITPQVIAVRSEAALGQVVDQWPKPGEVIVDGVFRLCVSDGRDAPRTQMPNLVGQRLEAGQQSLSALGIRATPTVRRADRQEPQGVIYAQSPRPGTRVRASTRVTLDVSNGPPTFMPNLLGRQLEGARQVLAGLGIQAVPNVQVAEHPEPRGVIFGQSPAAGMRVNAATPVILEVSTGPPILMPDLVGRPLDQGRQMLDGLGIRVTPNVRQAEHREPRDVIYGQSPAEGTRVNAATRVLLEVSTGPPPILMPDLAGRPLDQGRQALLSLGIGGNAEIRRARHPEPLNAIYDQFPVAGARVTAATAIVLDVSDGEIPPAVVPDLPSHSESEAIALLRDADLVAVRDASEASEIFAEGQVIRSTPAAGERVPPRSRVHYVLSLGPPPDPENPILRWLKDNLAVLIALLGGIALAVKFLVPRRPRFSVELAGPPRGKADWGRPPELAFDVRFDPPKASLRIRAAESDEEGA